MNIFRVAGILIVFAVALWLTAFPFLILDRYGIANKLEISSMVCLVCAVLLGGITAIIRGV